MNFQLVIHKQVTYIGEVFIILYSHIYWSSYLFAVDVQADITNMHHLHRKIDHHIWPVVNQ